MQCVRAGSQRGFSQGGAQDGQAGAQGPPKGRGRGRGRNNKGGFEQPRNTKKGSHTHDDGRGGAPGGMPNGGGGGMMHNGGATSPLYTLLWLCCGSPGTPSATTPVKYC